MTLCFCSWFAAVPADPVSPNKHLVNVSQSASSTQATALRSPMAKSLMNISMKAKEDDFESITNSTSLISIKEFVLQWTDMYGGVRGQDSGPKMCPPGTFIRRMIIVIGNQYCRINGITRIGQATCSDGRKLSCCDGGRLRLRGDRKFLFKTQSGFTRGQINHADTVRGLCLDNGKYWGCAGTDARRYEFNCIGNRRVRGFETRSDQNVNALSFLCG